MASLKVKVVLPCMAEEEDPELEHLRRLLAPMNEERLSRIQRMISRLITHKIKKGSEPKRDKNVA